MKGLNFTTLLQYIAVLMAAIFIGHWFLNEVKKAKINRQPWYKPYLSIPGLIILAALCLPLLFLFIN